jgi:hypothetical protein
MFFKQTFKLVFIGSLTLLTLFTLKLLIIFTLKLFLKFIGCSLIPQEILALWPYKRTQSTRGMSAISSFQ